MAERCPNHYPVRLGNDRYEWRPCLFQDGHAGGCEVDRTAPEPDVSEEADRRMEGLR